MADIILGCNSAKGFQGGNADPAYRQLFTEGNMRLEELFAVEGPKQGAAWGAGCSVLNCTLPPVPVLSS